MADAERDANQFIARVRMMEPAPPWTAVEAVVNLIALIVSNTIIAATAASLLSGGALDNASLLTGWGVGLALALLFTLVARRRTPEQFAALKLRKSSLLPLPLVALMGVAAALAAYLVPLLFTLTLFHPLPVLTDISGEQWVIALIVFAVLQPVVEGIIFHGVLLPRLRASWRPVAGYFALAMVYAAYFALIYAATLSGTALILQGILMPFVGALLIGLLRLRTGSTGAAILAFAMYNITLMLLGLAL